MIEFEMSICHTVDLLIFACLNFLIFGLLTKFRIREFLFLAAQFFSSAIIIIILTIFVNSRICAPHEIRKN